MSKTADTWLETPGLTINSSKFLSFGQVTEGCYYDGCGCGLGTFPTVHTLKFILRWNVPRSVRFRLISIRQFLGGGWAEPSPYDLNLELSSDAYDGDESGTLQDSPGFS